MKFNLSCNIDIENKIIFYIINMFIDFERI